MRIKLIEKDKKEKSNCKFENEINEFIKNKKIIDIKYDTKIIYQNFFETYEKNDFGIEGIELKSVLILYE